MGKWDVMLQGTSLLHLFNPAGIYYPDPGRGRRGGRRKPAKKGWAENPAFHDFFVGLTLMR